MQNFQYTAPATLAEAASAYGSGEDARFLAGGQTLIPVMKQRLAQPGALVDLARVTGLAGITAMADEIRIGAMTTHADVARSADVRRLIPALGQLAGEIGDPHVRNRGTIGGSLANNDPSADYPAAVMGLGGTVHTDRRAIPAEAFFQGLFTTALEDGEIITGVSFPVPKRAGYARMAHPASRFALVGVFVSQGPAGVRVAVTGAGESGVFRIAAMEEALGRAFAAGALEGIAVDPAGMLADMHAPAAYRAHLIGVLARRAVAAAVG